MIVQSVLELRRQLLAEPAFGKLATMALLSASTLTAFAIGLLFGLTVHRLRDGLGTSLNLAFDTQEATSQQVSEEELQSWVREHDLIPAPTPTLDINTLAPGEVCLCFRLGSPRSAPWARTCLHDIKIDCASELTPSMTPALCSERTICARCSSRVACILIGTS